MGYEVTIRCDSGKGDPVTKRQCITYGRNQREIVRHEATTSREAIIGVEMRAKALDWKRVQSAGRPVRWICPVCRSGS